MIRQLASRAKVLTRNFHLHEYQSKQIMKEFGVTVQKGGIALTPEEASKVSTPLNPKGGLIVKAQVHAGGRGKGTLTSGLNGGVQICKTPEEVAKYTKQMIGYNLKTKQTKAEGLPVKAVLIHEGVDIVKQIYLGLVLDRKHGGPVIISSKNGGMEIEEVARDKPESILIEPVDINKGLTKEQAEKIVNSLEFANDKQKNHAREELIKLYKMFIALDSTQVEINPWAVTPDDEVYCVDAKILIDDSASFRQKKYLDMKKNSLASEDVDPNEVKAEAIGINYVGLNGNIGCMVNGAGLAMSTMDIIKLKGAEPANFLDVGGGASAKQVQSAFEILASHPQVEGILVNIFGGIMRCDIVAEGVINACKAIDLKVPLVVRLTGTNFQLGLDMLDKFTKENKGKFKITTAHDLDDAATKIAKFIKK